MKKLSLTCAAVALMAATLPALAQDVGEVRVFHRWADEAARAPILAMFEVCKQKLPGLTISESYVPSDQYEVQLPVQLSSDTPPDIYGLWPGGRAVFQAQSDRILDITDLWHSEIASLMSPGMTEGVTETDGKIYVVPFNTLPNAFWYNKRLFDELGLSAPTTWDEFTTVLSKIKESGTTPITLGSRSGWEPLFWFDYLILRTAGPEFRERLMWGQESYTDPKVVAAMELWKGLLDAGYFNDNITSLSNAEMATAVISGQAAMQLMGPWTVSNFESAEMLPGEDYDFFPFPVIDPQVPNATEGAFEGFAASGKGPNTEGARRLLACLASNEAQTAYALDSDRIAANPNVAVETYRENVRGLIGQLTPLLEHSFHQNMELATLPPVTETAKREFPRFLTFPDQYMAVLESLEARAREVFE
jgi:multiple sugar transport system substrate-binding protein/raffinose/stachyose/melibiose transport system substrate-binding protein